MGADCGALERETSSTRHSDRDAFLHLQRMVHHLGSRVVPNSSTSESDVNPLLATDPLQPKLPYFGRS